MFENIIYFISALIISILYTKSGSEAANPQIAITGLFFSYVLFYIIAEKQFRKIKNLDDSQKAVSFGSVSSKLSITALGIFAVNIYILELPEIMTGIYIFSKFQTLLPFVLLLIFTAFMWILWSVSYPVFNDINPTDVSKKEYLLTQTGFALPSVLPWFIISVTLDFIYLLPNEKIHIFFETVYGQALYIAILIIVISAFIPVIIKKFWNCRELEDPETQEILNSLSEKTGVGYRQALVWPIFGGSMITAGVIGLFKRFRYILVTKGFCKDLSYEEKKAVIAHEFGHVKKHHLILYILLFAGFIIASYAVIEPAAMLFLLIVPVQITGIFEYLGNFSSLFAAVFVVLSFALYFRYIFGFFMRNFERQADAFSLKVLNSAYPLVSTFKKISAMSSEPGDKPNWHHYSIKERVMFLVEAHSNPEKINQHDKKVKKSLLIYFTAAALIFAGGTGLNNFEKSGLVKNKTSEIIKYKLSKDPDNYVLHHYMGDVYTEQKNFEQAVKHYKKALSINNNSVETLNNLAWLYITSENQKIKNLNSGIKLAEKALSIAKQPPPHLLDTLAEGYFRAEEYDKACYIIEDALQKANTNKKYYIEQKEKICSLQTK